MPTLESNGINIYYEVQGEGEPLVLIAGLGYGLWQWHKVVPGLAHHFKVITFDNRGVGQTDAPPGPYSARMMADDTAGLIKALNVAPVIVMGHSMGGFIAQELALSYPELVSQLVLASTNFGGPNHVPITPEAMAILTDTTLPPQERVRRGVLVACAEGFAERQPDVLEEIIHYRLSMPITPEGQMAQMQVGLGLLDYDNSFEPRLPELKMPVVVMSGDQDKTVPPANVGLMAQRIQDVKTYMLKDTSHLFMIEAPDYTVNALVGLLKG